MHGDEAEELVSIAREKKAILMVGHLLLYQPAIQQIKKIIESGEMGELQSLHQERLNLGTARAFENALWSLGVHDIAVLLFLVGAEPHKIEIQGQKLCQQTVEGDVYLHLTFRNGIQAHLHNSWLWPEKRRRLTIVGIQNILIYDEISQTVTLHRKGITGDLKTRDGGTEVVFQGSGEPLKLELEHFLNCIKTREVPISSGASAVAVVRVLESAAQKLERA
jgi:predicted dehydrogenase